MSFQTTRLTPTQLLALFTAVVLLFLLSMQYRLGVELADDGAFFLRYAENMLRGEFWVWNTGEAPVWGASAPLYPLIIAAPMALGVSPEASIIGVGLALSAVSLAATTLMLGHRFGVITGLAFLTFSALDTGIMYFSGAGLETPLTVALLSLGLWTLFYQPNEALKHSSPAQTPGAGSLNFLDPDVRRNDEFTINQRLRNAVLIGVVAGLLMVNKLDLVPVGVLLLLAHWLQDRRFPNISVWIAGILVLAWYGFAWWHFGAPVPNSFLTKSLHQNNQPKIIDWTWFGGFVFWVGIHKWLTGLSAFAIWRKRTSFSPVVVFLGGTLVVHLVAYTLKYPFEPYNWYAMPALFALLVCGAVGFGAFVELFRRRLPSGGRFSIIVAALALFFLVTTTIKMEILGTANIKMFSSHYEFDRAAAGRWVEANTPESFLVYTMWGNPAYYSKRKVLDGSFLNRKFEEADLIKKYRPEILILQNNPGSTPMNPVFAATGGEDYRVVKVFDKTYSEGMDYFFVVLAHKDVLNKIRNIDPPRDLSTFVNNIQLGDQFGIFRPQGLGTFFVHPGAKTPTTFDFAAATYFREGEKPLINIHARIAPNVPDEAVKRGGANVRVQIFQGDKELVDDIVRQGESISRDLLIINDQPLRFSVDNNGGADTDWLLLSIR